MRGGFCNEMKGMTTRVASKTGWQAVINPCYAGAPTCISSRYFARETAAAGRVAFGALHQASDSLAAGARP